MPNTQYWTKEKYNNKDFIFKWDIIEKARWTFESNWEIQYHQTWRTCFLYWPMWAVSDLTWCKFTKEDQDFIIDKAWKSEYANPKWWGYFWYWVKSVVDLYNSKYAKKWEHIEYQRFNMKKYWQEFVDKWYSIIIWYKHTKKLVQDKRDDWILNFSWWEYTWEDKWYWHCTRMTKIGNDNKIVNNYVWYTNNVFWIDNYKKEIDNWLFFDFWYVLLIKDWTKDWTEWFTLEQNEEYLRNRPEAIAKRKELENNK